MQTKIIGEILPVVTCRLAKGESVITQSGGMSWMEDGITMKTTTNGGIIRGVGRALAGDSLFINIYTAEREGAEITFSSYFPGKILEFNLVKGERIFVQNKVLLCSESTVDIKMVYKKKEGSKSIDGEGMHMQQITGPGKVYIQATGSVIEKELCANEMLKVDTSYVAAISERVQVGIEMLDGNKNVFFGGEGFLLTTLQGPGKIWLQSMPLYKFTNYVNSVR